MRNSSTKTISINVKKREIGQKTELFRQVSGDIAMIKIDTSDSIDLRIIKCGCTENIGVVANIRTYPINGAVTWIRKNSLFKSL